MKKILLFITCLCSTFLPFAQLNIHVTATPSNTPSADNIYVAGSFNGWNPGKDVLTKQTDGSYKVTIAPNIGVVEYKFTRGAWASVEGNANGTFTPNRKISYSGATQNVENQILSWEDKGNGGGTNPNSTAAANVKIVKLDFFMPQLNRTRRITIFLPKDYDAAPTKKYPVMYMHDGQNLFDASTSFAGEWKIDESLNKLFDNGDKGCIVVGIDNGGALRLSELTPYTNAKYGGGDGQKYIDFIINTLKPFIDQNYQTLSDRKNTGIGGSSLGGLISFYGAMNHQNVFEKALVFSPSFWWNAEIYNLVQQKGKQQVMKIFLMAGGNEEADDDVVVKTEKMYNNLLGKGFSKSEVYYVTHGDGAHSEWYWAREFSAAHQWLWNNTTSTEDAQNVDFQIFPNPTTQFVTLRFDGSERLTAEIYNLQGQRLITQQVAQNDRIFVGTLSSGSYNILLKKDGKTVQYKRLIVR